VNKGNTDTAAFYNTGSGDLYRCINRLYRFAIIFASSIAVMFIVIAGYLYMSAEGNQEAVDKAKAILTSCVASLVILFVGYILLRAINPELIEFKSIQPPSVVLPVAPPPMAAGHKKEELLTAGCTFQGSVGDEVPNMVNNMFWETQKICQELASKGMHPQISSITGGTHVANSYHYKGCAVDFAGNNTDFFNSATGQAIVQAAQKAGISRDRINPPPDDTKPDHVHIDLGGACPTK
jgi:hypothetical protein